MSKEFNEYVDGEWVVFNKPGHQFHLQQFKAYKSQYTFNAFRLVYGHREVIADITEINPLKDINQIMINEYDLKNEKTVDTSGVIPPDSRSDHEYDEDWYWRLSIQD